MPPMIPTSSRSTTRTRCAGRQFVITAVLGQLISNMATALIVIPIGVSATAQMDISAMPILVAIAVFAAAALLTPVATPANLMVQEAAGLPLQ